MRGLISFLAIFTACLVWFMPVGSVLADDPTPRISLSVAGEVVVGTRVDIAAFVTDAEDTPVEGAIVVFTRDIEFQNTFDTVTLGQAETDDLGIASLVYVPRSLGELSLTATVIDSALADFPVAESVIDVLPGGHLYHPEDLIHDLRGRWDWLVQWVWLVILPATAFAIYLLIMILLWAIGRDNSTANSPSVAGLKTRVLVPMGGAAMILTAAAVLILAITLRPWAGTDSGWRTELNLLHTVPTDYERSLPAYVDAEPTLNSWKPLFDGHAKTDEERLQTFVGYGCASCHGIEFEGAAVGEDLTEASPSDIRKSLDEGAEGMPSYSSLTDADVASLVLFLTGKQTEAQVEPVDRPLAEVVSTPVVSVATKEPSTDVNDALTPPSVATPGSAEATAVSVDAPEPTSATTEEPGPISFEAVQASIIVDGDISDWSDVPVTTVPMQQIKPLPGTDMGELLPSSVDVRMALDSQMAYVLLEVADDYDYVADDHGLSSAVAIMFKIDNSAAPHMGTTEEDQKKSLGKVDIWHWELDCGPGEVSGGVVGTVGGNDRACNFDDEYAKTPEDLEDDDSIDAENSLAGVWNHTARDEGNGAIGKWIFEMSRPLQTGDPDDAQFVANAIIHMALAYWDADETPDGWTDEGHLQSSSGGWIEIKLP